MKRILLAFLVVAVTAGVASADHRHRWRGGFRGGVVVSAPRVVVAPRVIAPRVRVVRQPIYVPRPAIRVRYYNYYQRPAVIAESYPPRTGYYWIAGRWDWNGYEWIWTPGYYQPDPNYQDTSYDYQSSGYYQGGGYYQGDGYYQQGGYYEHDCD